MNDYKKSPASSWTIILNYKLRKKSMTRVSCISCVSWYE